MRGFVHKGLKALYADDIAKGVPPDSVDKLRKMLAFLDDMQDVRRIAQLAMLRYEALRCMMSGHVL